MKVFSYLFFKYPTMYSPALIVFIAFRSDMIKITLVQIIYLLTLLTKEATKE